MATRMLARAGGGWRSVGRGRAMRSPSDSDSDSDKTSNVLNIFREGEEGGRGRRERNGADLGRTRDDSDRSRPEMTRI